MLPIAATYRASLHVHAGAFDAASSLIEEVDAITQATGMAPLKYAALMLAAWRGDEARGCRLIATTMLPRRRREARAWRWACSGGPTALLYNGHGRYGEALAAAQRGCEHEDVDRVRRGPSSS